MYFCAGLSRVFRYDPKLGIVVAPSPTRNSSIHQIPSSPSLLRNEEVNKSSQVITETALRVLEESPLTTFISIQENDEYFVYRDDEDEGTILSYKEQDEELFLSDREFEEAWAKSIPTHAASLDLMAPSLSGSTDLDSLSATQAASSGCVDKKLTQIRPLTEEEKLRLEQEKQKRLNERAAFHSAWVAKYKQTQEGYERERLASRLTIMRELLRENPNFRKKWDVIKKALNHPIPLALSQIIYTISVTHAWNGNLTLFDEDMNKHTAEVDNRRRAKQGNILIAIQNAENRRREDPWRQSDPPILFASQLPLQEQIELGILPSSTL